MKNFCRKLPNGLIIRTNDGFYAYKGPPTSKSAYKAQQKTFARKMKSHLIHGQAANRTMIEAIKLGFNRITDLCKTVFRIEYKPVSYKNILGQWQWYLPYTLFGKSVTL